jgi:transposase, IS5 family
MSAHRATTARRPDETRILRFRHLLERHDLAVDMPRAVNDLLQPKGHPGAATRIHWRT